MDNFKIIYHILKTLEKALDYSEFDYSVLSAESLGISEERRKNLLKMLYSERFIDDINKPKITLLGLEYLQENSLMKKLRT